MYSQVAQKLNLDGLLRDQLTIGLVDVRNLSSLYERFF